jgi:hypothetical protein
MHSHPSDWKTFLTKLGFVRTSRRTARKPNYSRRLRFEDCEDRRMLAPIVVTSLLDNGDGDKTTQSLRIA